MEIRQISSLVRPGTPGLDVFKIAGRSISGFLPSFKTGDSRRVRVPFTTHLEERLALFLEYHPHVQTFQRGDASSAFVEAYRLCTPLPTPYRISYLYDGKPHDYLPDFVGTLCDGGLLIAEAGREEEKSQGRALLKAEAARRLAQLKGGVYWLGTDANLSERRHQNLLYLHARRRSFPTYEEIAETLLAHWAWGEMHTVHELIQCFGSHWSEAEVEAAVWKLVADAAAQGRLLVDLSEVDLSHLTPLALLEPHAPPILPDPLPSQLLEAEPEPGLFAHEQKDEDEVLDLRDGLPGPTFDASVLANAEHQALFHRNLAAVTAVLSGRGIRGVAEAYAMAPSTLSRLVHRAKELGQIACVPYATYHRDRKLRPEFQQVIRTLYTHPLRPTVMAVYEDEQLARLAKELGEREGKDVAPPTYHQVYDFIKKISEEAPVTAARSGLKHPPRERMSPSSFVLSIAHPALVCQVDEHTMDQLVVTLDGTVITRRVHGAVLICVKTAAVLGAVLSLDSLKEEDYMRLVKQALEPKDDLVRRYECKHAWPCSGKPAVIFHDRGKIFTSERATQVLVDRLGIVTEQAPSYAPSAKGTVEAVFTWTTRKFEHRLPGTTKANTTERGTYDSVWEAEKAGITLDVLEKLFMHALVDGYMQEWDSLSPHHGLSFLGYRYVSPGLLDRLRGKEIDIYYDRRDISVIYLFLEGELVGEAYCTESLGRRVSVWEAAAERRASATQAKKADAESLENRQRIQREARSGKRAQAREARRLEQQRHLDQQRSDIHPDHVQSALQVLANLPKETPPPPPMKSLLAPAVPDETLATRSEPRLPMRKREVHRD